MKKEIAILIKNIFSYISLFCLSFLYGKNNEKLKELKKYKKENEKHIKNRKYIRSLSRDELLKYLHKK